MYALTRLSPIDWKHRPRKMIISFSFRAMIIGFDNLLTRKYVTQEGDRYIDACALFCRLCCCTFLSSALVLYFGWGFGFLLLWGCGCLCSTIYLKIEMDPVPFAINIFINMILDYFFVSPSEPSSREQYIWCLVLLFNSCFRACFPPSSHSHIVLE